MAISRLQFLDGAGGGSLVENLLRSLSSAAALSVECEGYNVGQDKGIRTARREKMHDPPRDDLGFPGTSARDELEGCGRRARWPSAAIR